MIFNFLYAIMGAFIASLMSLSGIIFRFISQRTIERILPKMVGIGIGLLLGNAFLHLIPEAFEVINSITIVSIMVLIGVMFFFFLERALHDVGQMNLAGDVIHNFIDGTVIALSFIAGPEIGLVTTLAIVAHEVPQELSKTGAMLFSGYTLQRTIKLNFIVSLSALLGVVVIFLIEDSLSHYIAYLTPFTAGGFIYIATSSMMPALNRAASIAVQGFTVTIGIVIAAALSHF